MDIITDNRAFKISIIEPIPPPPEIEGE